MVYPDEGNGRKREYVGADEVKIKEAIDKLQRGTEHDKCDRAIKELEKKMDNCRYYLRQAKPN